MSESLHTFGSQHQNNPNLCFGVSPQLLQRPIQHVASDQDAIVQYIEAAICGLIPRYAEKMGLAKQLSARIDRDWLLKSKSQRRLICLARQTEWVLLRHIPELHWSFPEIARYFNNDHTTVMSGYKRIAIGCLVERKNNEFAQFVRAVTTNVKVNASVSRFDLAREIKSDLRKKRLPHRRGRS